MTVVQQLFDLLGVDVEIDRNSQTLASVDASLADNRLLVETQRAVKAARDTLRVQESERLDLELTVGTSQDKGKQLESKLYGGTVRIPRELEDMQLELSLLREHQKQQEESLLLALEAADETEQELGDLESNLQEMQTSWQEEHERLLNCVHGEAGGRLLISTRIPGLLQGRRRVAEVGCVADQMHDGHRHRGTAAE